DVLDRAGAAEASGALVVQGNPQVLGLEIMSVRSEDKLDRHGHRLAGHTRAVGECLILRSNVWPRDLIHLDPALHPEGIVAVIDDLNDVVGAPCRWIPGQLLACRGSGATGCGWRRGRVAREGA